MASWPAQVRESLCCNKLDGFGEVLHQGWLEKKRLASGISNERIDGGTSRPAGMAPSAARCWAPAAGAFCCSMPSRRTAGDIMRALPELRPIPFRFEPQGSKIIYVEENGHHKSLLLSAHVHLISVGFSMVGQVALKSGMSQVGRIGEPRRRWRTGDLVWRVATTPLVMFGLACYALGAVAWLVVLSRLDLSYAYPFLALNFVLITVASRFVLGETVPLLRWLGVIVICFGVVLVARS